MSDEVKLLPCEELVERQAVLDALHQQLQYPTEACAIVRSLPALEATGPSVVTDEIERARELLAIWDAAPFGEISQREHDAHQELMKMGPVLARIAIEATRPTEEVVAVENVCPVCRGDAAKCACEVSDLQRTST